MATLNLTQEQQEDPINLIIFVEPETADDYCVAVSIKKAANARGQVWINDRDHDPQLSIESVKDAETLIKALQKAIELGWFE